MAREMDGRVWVFGHIHRPLNLIQMVVETLVQQKELIQEIFSLQAKDGMNKLKLVHKFGSIYYYPFFSYSKDIWTARAGLQLLVELAP